nr:endonuclease/exonuclease/phosphatase family protein [Sphingomonas sp. ID1715]
MQRGLNILAATALAFTSVNPALASNPAPAAPAPLSVLTYNVKGLPWPVARGRTDAFRQIAARLLTMRREGRQPHVIVLQEAFTDAAKRIGQDAGYRYIVYGPSKAQLTQARMTAEDQRFAEEASWLKGETEGKWADSGLEIASDYPVLNVQRAAFPGFACAGFDCLANKGVLLVTLKIPGEPTPFAIATAHLNSRHSSGVSDGRSLYAYRRQLDFLRSFFIARRDPAIPLVFAGDFNISELARRTALFEQIGRWWPGTEERVPRDGLRTCLARLSHNSRAFADATFAMRRARDWQFIVPGRLAAITAIGMTVPFGRDPTGAMLSDHVGYVIDYAAARMKPTA